MSCCKETAIRIGRSSEAAIFWFTVLTKPEKHILHPWAIASLLLFGNFIYMSVIFLWRILPLLGFRISYLKQN